MILKVRDDYNGAFYPVMSGLSFNLNFVCHGYKEDFRGGKGGKTFLMCFVCCIFPL